MEKTVLFRDFEERDISFVYKCKNDETLNAMIVGSYHPLSYAEAVEWVHGCMGQHDSFKFWAICSNDQEKRIVGWTSIARIDEENRSACFYSIVIGDPQYRKGIAWIEAQQFILEYAFQHLHLNRLEYSCLSEHHSSMSMGPVLFFKQEGLARQAVYRNNRYYDVAYFSLLEDEYLTHLKNGDYDFSSILMRYAEYHRHS